MQLAGDADHLLHAAQDDAILVTRDRGFLGLNTAWRLWADAWQVWPRPQHAGILLIPGDWPVPRAAGEIHAFVQLGWPLPNRLYEHDRVQGWLAR